MGDEESTAVAATEALDRLIESCPSFLGATDLFEYLAWSEEEGRPDPFVRASALAVHLVRLAERRDVSEWPGVADAVEALLEGGDRDQEELVRVGVIETLQNVCSHDDVAVSDYDILYLLGPRGQEEWIDVGLLWERASQSLQEGPRVTEADYAGVQEPNLKLYLQTMKRRLPDGTTMSMGDVLAHETAVADATWRTPAGRRRTNRRALAVGLILALAAAVAITLWR
jgi:hypothetical protein